jgi:uncharacterized protein (TIGR00162 family)
MKMIDKTLIRRKKNLKLSKPILVVGLPGIGNVGKLVAEHLKREFKAEKIGTVYSPHFPHQVVMLKNGGVRIVNNRFYLIKAKKQGASDIVILTGDAQAVSPEGQYEVNAKIVDFFKNGLGGKFIYTIGGYSLGEAIPAKPRVFGNVSSKDVIATFKGTDVIFSKSKGIIWGSAGLIVAFAKMQKIDAVCLMGETSFLDVDASAAKAVIIQLAKCLNLNVDTANLDRIIERTAKVVRELERQAGGMISGQQAPYQFQPDKDERSPSYIR